MSTPDVALRCSVLLSLQRALWDVVTPELRAVAASWTRELISVRFIYEFERTEQEELVSEADTAVLADFFPAMNTKFTIEVLPPGELRRHREGEWWIYRRYEPDD
jgi:hypothetical protein